jgi:hypothetical protein
MRRQIHFGFMVAGGLLSSCSNEPLPRTSISVVVDSAGVVIVQHGDVYAADLPSWRLGPEPLMSIGADAETPDYQFHRIQDVTRLNDGSVAVIDYSRTLRLFDSAGAHAWTAGGEGEGPGEFRFPNAVHVLDADSLLVWDGLANRLSVFTRSGHFVRDASASAFSRPTATRGITGRGDILIEERAAERVTIDGHRAIRYPSDFYLVNLDSEAGTNLGRRMYATEFQEVDENGAFSPAIFATSAVIAPSHDGLWYGDTQEYELREEVGLEETRRVVRWRGPDRTVHDSDVRAVLAMWSEGAEPEARRYLAEYGRTHPRADHFPAYAKLIVDQAGRLWVQDYVKDHADDGRRRWLVFSPDGEQVLARATMPASLEAYDIGDNWVLGVQKDDLGVEAVVLYNVLLGSHEQLIVR